jgi:hypothetical protein
LHTATEPGANAAIAAVTTVLPTPLPVPVTISVSIGHHFRPAVPCACGAALCVCRDHVPGVVASIQCWLDTSRRWSIADQVPDL